MKTFTLCKMQQQQYCLYFQLHVHVSGFFSVTTFVSLNYRCSPNDKYSVECTNFKTTRYKLDINYIIPFAAAEVWLAVK
jgi:hypothetical protein